MKRQGKDLTMVAPGMNAQRAIEATAELAKEGIAIEVIDPRSLLPFDCHSLVISIRKTNRLVIVHKASRTDGIGAEIAAITIKETFGYIGYAYCKESALRTFRSQSARFWEKIHPPKKDIMNAVRRMIA